ncbi:tripartite tricarboxylate transporter substrate binding protein [Bordetella petrii]|nr:tripartite tricarboxylate transporter substrate binding protein [Bordetella petrii]
MNIQKNGARQPAPARRRILRAAALGLALAAAMPALQTAAAADAWPSQPIRLVVPFPPGGSVDTVARTLGPALQQALGQPIIIENKPGASSVLGARHVKQADPDGYTLLLNASLQVANPLLLDTVTYDALNDFTPITEIGAQPQLILVRQDSPYKTLADLVAAAKAKPGELTWAIAAYGAAGHLACELVNEQAGVNMEVIPYRGGGPALVDLMGGQVTAMTEPMASAYPHVQGGKLRALAVTSNTRVPTVPDLPTVAEAGYAGFDMPSWYGIWAPAGTPQAAVQKIYEATRKALQDPAVKAKFGSMSFMPVGSTPKEFAAFQANEYQTYGKVIKIIKSRGANAAPRT